MKNHLHCHQTLLHYNAVGRTTLNNSTPQSLDNNFLHFTSLSTLYCTLLHCIVHIYYCTATLVTQLVTVVASICTKRSYGRLDDPTRATHNYDIHLTVNWTAIRGRYKCAISNWEILLSVNRWWHQILSTTNCTKLCVHPINFVYIQLQ